MNRTDLILHLATLQPHLPIQAVELSVKALLDVLSQTLSKGDRIEIRGFGSFEPSYRPPRKGRNPKTGEAVLVPSKYVPHFKPGKEFRERVNYK